MAEIGKAETYFQTLKSLWKAIFKGVDNKIKYLTLKKR